MRPLPKPYGQKNVRPSPESIDPEQKIDVDCIEPEVRNGIEENSPYQEGPYEETIARPTEKNLVVPPSLESQIKKELLVHKYLPKQIDLERLLKTHTKENIKRYTFICHSKRSLCRICPQVHILKIYIYI